ncbi:MAG: hypothetical protein HY832_00505 [Candidatus Aenigmarchaeota archaeon]|nr:hypothetical protein [Candidatus Aenigmarchaeota archaeon]
MSLPAQPTTEVAHVPMVAVAIPKIYSVGSITGLNRYEPRGFAGQISTGITNYDLPLKDTIGGEITLADQNTLFQAYLMNKFGALPLPDNVKDIVYRLFDERGKGNKTSTIVDYDKGNNSLRKTKETDKRAQVIVKASRFWRDSDGTVKYTPAEDSDIVDAILSREGYTEWTCDGDRHPRTGFAFSNNPSRTAAVKTWTDKGFPKKFANTVVSYEYTRNEGYTCRWC